MPEGKIEFKYPSQVTETFDDANFHINYCLSFIKKYLKGNIVEVGAGCGSFTRHFFNHEINTLTLTEKDQKNFEILNEKYSGKQNIFVTKESIFEIQKQFDVVMYLHVLEHIKEDEKEILEATKKVKKNGVLIIMAPAHQQMFSNLDRHVGHFRRYEKDFFDDNFPLLKRIEFKFLDSSGYFLYKLNRLFFKNEKLPSKFKIFIWDKIFTPISVIFDFLLGYRVGKCILAIYKKV